VISWNRALRGNFALWNSSKSRGEAIMSFVVDVTVDKPVFLIPLPEGTNCNQIIASPEPTRQDVQEL